MNVIVSIIGLLQRNGGRYQYPMISGWAQVCVMHPFEIIKVRLQTQSNTNKIYNGIVDCLTKIVKS